MLERILNALLPEKSASPAMRRMWTAGFLLFPLALAAGFLLLVRNAPPSPVPVSVSAGEAVRIARDFAIRQGIPAASWRASRSSGSQDQLLKFLNASRENARLWNVAPPLYGKVKLQAPDTKESVTVRVSADGKILGFETKNIPVSGGKLADADARRLATARLPPGFHFGEPSIDKNDSLTTYAFHSSDVRGADLVVEIGVAGDRVVSDIATANVEGWAEKGARSAIVQTLLSIAGSFFVCVVAVFSIYRYASRAMQGEISHRRSLTVALLCGFFCMVFGSNAVVNGSPELISLALIALIFAVLGLIGGALLAAAYGSGEGDIREAWPGKLTSLDALLSGHVFSRNVGASTLGGVAFAGWLILALAILTMPLKIAVPQGNQGMLTSFLRFAWLMPLVTYPLMALGFAAAGLLQPLAFLQLFVRRAPRWHLPTLLLSGFLVSTLRPHAPTDTEFLASSAILVAALLIPFFLQDLFASLVCMTTVFSLIGCVTYVAALHGHAAARIVWYAAVVCSVSVFGLICVSRGKAFTEEEVRPLYARHIAERKSLEAEVSAAREAQLRLLPESVPEFEGLCISAACVPAETVGGDFYDFFPLGDGRLGVFLAEGNNRGLAAALTIALAKGYLMQCVERFREPVEILTRLETALVSIFGTETSIEGPGSAPTAFAFAAIDTVKGEVRYARTGVYPKVVVVSANRVPVTERMVPIKGRAAPIVEGWAPLEPGDHIVLFTDGIGRRLAATNRKPEDVACALASRASGGVEELRERFLALSKGGAEPDDLTVVIIRRNAESLNESALRVVA
ncbi:MAG TPA: SpoIIE family protein phosphatase [Bryobacteraceae bacterium]|nr:SpoIIE family protein phosphatase [Bryobacteraceae bacterium]